jgi:hypothetical protein
VLVGEMGREVVGLVRNLVRGVRVCVRNGEAEEGGCILYVLGLGGLG